MLAPTWVHASPIGNFATKPAEEQGGLNGLFASAEGGKLVMAARRRRRGREIKLAPRTVWITSSHSPSRLSIYLDTPSRQTS